MPFPFIPGGLILALLVLGGVMVLFGLALTINPLGLLIGVIILMQLTLGLGAWIQADGAMGLRQAVTPDMAQMENTRALGLLIYDKYLLLFQLSGLILLVAMIGAIVLTLRHRKDIKRQNILHQMWRDPAKAMELRDVKPGQGL